MALEMPWLTARVIEESHYANDGSGVRLCGHRQPACAGDDAALAARNLLVRIEAPWAAAFRGLD